MPTLTITRGFPGSGKSTWAKKQYSKTTVGVNRDLLRMMLEIAATKFSEETWAKMTGLPFITTQQRQQVEAVAQAAQMTGQPLDPQTQQQLQAPVWGQVLQVLQDDMQRAYRIDIETNSTIEPEAAEDQKQLTELMTALGQTMNGLAPLVAQGVLPFEVAQSMLLVITRRFRFGEEIESIIQKMQPPQPKDDGKAEGEKAKAEVQTMQQQVQVQAKEAEMGVKMKEMAAQQQLMQKENDLAMREMELQMREEKLRMQEQLATEKLAMKEHTFKTQVSATDKVRSIKDAGSKREEQVAKSADTKLATGVSALQSTVEQLATMQTQLLQTVAQQSEKMQTHMDAMMSTMMAPKKKKIIRGKDGRPEGLEETVA